jgi:hypothetical protein
VAVHKTRWVGSSNQPADDYAFFCGNGNANHLGKSFFIHKGIISAVKRVEIFSGRMLCITLRGCLCDVFMNVHAPTEDRSDDMKDNFY